MVEGEVLSTELMDKLTDEYIQRLAKGDCEPADQKMAAVIIDQRITLLRNTVKALSGGKPCEQASSATG